MSKQEIELQDLERMEKALLNQRDDIQSRLNHLHDQITTLSNKIHSDKLKVGEQHGQIQFVYGTINRPAGYGTIPDGYWRQSVAHHILSDSQPYYSSVAYDHKLTVAELYKYEMAPISHNAFDFQIGDRVIANDDTGVVVHLMPRNRYGVKLDYDATTAIYHATDIVADTNKG